MIEWAPHPKSLSKKYFSFEACKILSEKKNLLGSSDMSGWLSKVGVGVMIGWTMVVAGTVWNQEDPFRDDNDDDFGGNGDYDYQDDSDLKDHDDNED